MGADKIVDLIRAFHPKICGIERGQADPVFVARIQDGIKEYRLQCQIVSYSSVQDEARGMRGKFQRIAALEPYFANGLIYLRRGATLRDLLAQLDGYPNVDHDDVVDALAMQRRFVQKCQDKTEYDLESTTETEEEFESWGPEGPPRQKVARSSGTWVGYQGQRLPGLRYT